MTHITVSDEQARLISEASAPIVFVDVRGRELGKLDRNSGTSVPDVSKMTEEEWTAEALRRRDQAKREGWKGGFTTQEVLAHLRALKPE